MTLRDQLKKIDSYIESIFVVINLINFFETGPQ